MTADLWVDAWSVLFLVGAVVIYLWKRSRP